MNNNKKFIIDTNILVYLSDKKSCFYDKVIKKLKFLYKNKYEIFVTNQIKREALVCLTNINKKIKKPKPVIKILNEINSILKFIPVLYETEKSLGILDELIFNYKISGYKIHDMNIVSVAIANNIKYILTHNIKDFSFIKEINVIGLTDE